MVDRYLINKIDTFILTILLSRIYLCYQEYNFIQANITFSIVRLVALFAHAY